MEKLIKICKHHGHLYEKDVIKNGKNKSGTLRLRCRKCMKDMHARHYEKNKDKVKAYQRKMKELYPEKTREARLKCYHKNQGKWQKTDYARKKRQAYGLKVSEKLFDIYIKKLLCKKGILTHAYIPDELVALKKAALQLSRLIKRKKHELLGE